MNETQIIDALRELAAKLGTTSEYLWQVLIRQAPISGTVNLLVCIAWAYIAVWGFRLVSAKTKLPPKTKDEPHPSSEWDDEGRVAAWILWGIYTLVGTIIAGCSLEYIVGALINPEYWALTQVLHQVH